jgi:DNA topoisomerase-1
MARATAAERKAVEGKRYGGPGRRRAPAEKRHAITGAMVPVRRVGKGKEAKFIREDGSEHPSHVKPSAIPPAWTDVQVSVDPNSDVEAIGKDAKGRWNKKYKDTYLMENAAVKFARVRELIDEFPGIQRRIQELRRSRNLWTREAADCAWLIAEQGTRPGSNRDTKANQKAYGATTLTAEHVKARPDGVYLEFIGKKGVPQNHKIEDPALATMLIRRAQTANDRGGHLFLTNESRLNRFLKSQGRGGYTAKDLRTHKATSMALDMVRQQEAPPTTKKEYKARIKAIATAVSQKLGNNPSESLKSYISPHVFERWTL